jgi:2-keto-4-pentenoate hydratase/2-oxohepta-3-ene-1,7-dioic acid hydratase in catechol pathway
LRLCNFALPGEPRTRARAGVVQGTRVFEMAAGKTMDSLLEASGRIRKVDTRGDGHPISRVVLFPPVMRPGEIIATIVNTRGMLGGPDVKLDRPRLDKKAPSSVIGPGELIRAPRAGIRPEVELAAIIGRRLAGVGKRQAASGILGFTVLNDVTAPADSRADAYEAYRRDKKTGEIKKSTMRGPLFRSKNHDTFCPMGPWISTRDENDDWSDLRMTSRFDDLLVQDGSTSEYIFAPEQIASYVSSFLALEPGDVISCGSVGWTPEAKGALDPTEFVLSSKKGTLELEIEGVGVLRNPVAPAE